MVAPATPRQVAETLAAFVDVLLPGDDTFPAAADTGTHLWLMEKVRSDYDPDTIHRIVRTLDPEGQFAQRPASEQEAAVHHFEQAEPDLFGFTLNVVYLGYYQTPPVVEAVRSLGRDYNHSPQPDGYELAPFDPSTLPVKPRGHYVKTNDVKRVDVSGIDMAGLEQQWR